MALPGLHWNGQDYAVVGELTTQAQAYESAGLAHGRSPIPHLCPDSRVQSSDQHLIHIVPPLKLLCELRPFNGYSDTIWWAFLPIHPMQASQLSQLKNIKCILM